MTSSSSSSSRLMVRPLSDELCEKARKYCNESPEAAQSDIITLQTWIKKSPHLKARLDAQLLLSFLRRCQFDLEGTKARIDAYFSLKSALKEVLCERQVNASLLELFNGGIHVIPKKPISPAGPRVVISQFAKYDVKKSNLREAFKLLFMLLELLAIEDDNASVAGLVYVIDGRDVSMDQMLQYDPLLLRKIWVLVERCLPLKFSEVHLINMRRDGEAVFKFVTNFLPVEMPFKFIVHKKAEDLYEHLPRDAMTIEYGGHNGYQAEALDVWRLKLQQFREYFAKDSNFGTNEKLRFGLNSGWELDNELSGLSGTFRKLEVD